VCDDDNGDDRWWVGPSDSNYLYRCSPGWPAPKGICAPEAELWGVRLGHLAGKEVDHGGDDNCGGSHGDSGEGRLEKLHAGLKICYWLDQRGSGRERLHLMLEFVCEPGFLGEVALNPPSAKWR